MAVVVATGITADGGREVLGLDVGDSEDEVFWRGFLSALKRRGLTGVRLVISDQHAGLVAALKCSFQGAAHQRCQVHYADLRVMPMWWRDRLWGKGFVLARSLRTKKITAHTLRHTTAMRLLHAGIDTSIIALWLGHARVETTQTYLHADLKLKEKAVARTRPPHGRTGRYKPPDTLLAWLEAL